MTFTDDDMLKFLKFSYRNREYTLEFRQFRLLKLQGESGSGKSMLSRDLSKRMNEIEGFGGQLDHLVIAWDRPQGLDLIKSGAYKKYSLVVIDNADILINPEIDNIIYNDIFDPESSTYWIIIGRRYFNCCCTSTTWSVLKHKEGKNGEWKIINDFVVSPDLRRLSIGDEFN